MRFGDFKYQANFYSALGHSVRSFIVDMKNFRNVETLLDVPCDV